MLTLQSNMDTRCWGAFLVTPSTALRLHKGGTGWEEQMSKCPQSIKLVWLFPHWECCSGKGCLKPRNKSRGRNRNEQA